MGRSSIGVRIGQNDWMIGRFGGLATARKPSEKCDVQQILELGEVGERRC